MTRFQRTFLVASLGVASILGCNDSPYSGRKRVDLSGRQVCDSELPRLVPAHRVTELYLGDSGVGDSAMDHVARCIYLEALDLTANNVTDPGIAKIANLPRLKILWLDHTAVSDSGLRSLAQCQTLKEIYALNTHVTANGATYLRKTIPGVHIEWSTVSSEEVRRACVGLHKLGITVGVKPADDPMPRERCCYLVRIARPLEETREKVAGLLGILCEADAVDLRLGKESGSDISWLGHLRGSSSPTDLSLLPQLEDSQLKVLRSMDKLRSLFVSSPYLTDAATATIADISSLEELALRSPHITSRGLKCLQRLKGLKKLELFLQSFGVEEMREIAGINSLEEAIIECQNKLSAEEIDHLKSLSSARVEIYPEIGFSN